MADRKPFPQIPRYPEGETRYEDGRVEPVEAESSLEGPPISPGDSAFRLEEPAEKVAESFNQYNRGNSQERSRVVNNVADGIVENPNNLLGFFRNLDTFREISTKDREVAGEEGEPNFGDFEDRVLDRVTERFFHRATQNPDYLINFLSSLSRLREIYEIDNDKWREEVLLERFSDRLDKKGSKAPSDVSSYEKWFKLYVESGIYGNTAGKIIEKWVAETKTTKETVDILYNIARAGLTSNNEEVVKKTLEVFCYQDKILRADTKQGLNIMLSIFDLNNETLKKALEINGVVKYMARKLNLEELLDKQTEAQDIGIKSLGDEFQSGIKRLSQQDPDRYEALYKLHTRREDEMGLINVRDSSTFPDSLLVEDIGPLQKWIGALVAQEIGQRTGQVSLECSLGSRTEVRSFRDKHELARFLTSQYNKLEEGTIQESVDHWRTFSHLLPESVDGDILDNLNRLNRELITIIRDEARHFLSLRGDRILMQDSILTDIGLRSVLFQMNPDNLRETDIVVRVGNVVQRAKLDESINLLTVGSENLTLPEDGSFIKYVILSYLKSILCEGEIIQTTATRGNRREGDERQFISRRAHLRRLPQGQLPTPNQTERAWNSPYKVDLTHLNRERESRGLGKVTFVFESEVDLETLRQAGPMNHKVSDEAKEIYEMIGRKDN